VGGKSRYNLRRCMALRFISASAQHRFIPLCYALPSKGEPRGEQRMWGTLQGCTLVTGVS
jgi:hypothetical protein